MPATAVAPFMTVNVVAVKVVESMGVLKVALTSWLVTTPVEPLPGLVDVIVGAVGGEDEGAAVPNADVFPGRNGRESHIFHRHSQSLSGAVRAPSQA